MPPIHVTAETFEQDVLASDVPVLVDFWAAWCPPCRMIAPILDQLAERHDGRLKVAKLDVDADPGLAATYRVSGIPTLILFENGAPAKTLVGARPLAALEAELGLTAPAEAA
jgi:thioredoxin 1